MQTRTGGRTLEPEQETDNPRRPNPIDVHVGGRLRLRRMLLGLSQDKLGEKMGLTFQQIQKYEKGTNRIGASRLFHLSQVLGVPVQYFFEEAPNYKGRGGAVSDRPAGFSEPEGEPIVYDFLNSREGLELNRAFVRIQDAKVRRKMIDLVRALANDIDS